MYLHELYNNLNACRDELAQTKRESLVVRLTSAAVQEVQDLRYILANLSLEQCSTPYSSSYCHLGKVAAKGVQIATDAAGEG